MSAWWCSSCRERVDSSDGKCPICRGVVEHSERRTTTSQLALSKPLVKTCSRCGKLALHRERTDRPGKPRAICKGCDQDYLKQYRSQNWARVKARETWRGMIRRCHDPRTRCYWGRIPSWRDYGAIGVAVAERWRGPGGFARFVADLGLPPTPYHTLDRRNSNKGYTPRNARWVEPGTQRANRKNSHWVRARNPQTGKIEWHTLSDWARITGVERRTIARRLKLRWSADRAVAEPTSAPF